MLVQQTPQAITPNSTLAHLVADHKSAAAMVRGVKAKFWPQQRRILAGQPKHHEGSLMSASNTMQAIETTMASQAHGGWQSHQPSGIRSSNGESDPSALAPGADHTASGMGAHADPETRDTFALAAGSPQSAFGHIDVVASGRAELETVSVSPYRSASCRRSPTWGHRLEPGSGH